MISFLSQIKETTRKPNCQSYNFLKWKKRNCFVRMGVFPKCKNIKLVGKEKTKQNNTVFRMITSVERKNGIKERGKKETPSTHILI